VGQEWKVEDIELDPPKAGEVLVEVKAAGLCHSDDLLVTGETFPDEEAAAAAGLDIYPIIGGHEGAGVVVEVGPGVTSVQPGDHVSTSFVPSCGHCRYCMSGKQNLCDLGAGTMLKGQISDGTVRHHLDDGTDLNTFSKLGTFSEHTVVAETSLIKVEPDLPMTAVCLVSCGVATGWGSAVVRADTQPGDTVVVVGIGGIGINAVQGARMAGALRVVAVDPVEFKREQAMRFGATHTVASIDEAIPLVQELTWGQMADRVIMTPGIVYGEMMAGAMTLTGKGGTCVVTGASPLAETHPAIPLLELTMWQKEVRGALFGSLQPRLDIPRLLALYQGGLLKLDELVTRTYSLDQINQGYQDMRDGLNIRGVITFE
jgi:S-(hydroxymethyl)glutathione dehydrogenase/alcohol dehydrogenase